VYSNEIAINEAARAREPGLPVTLVADNGQRLGTFFYNPHALIAARLVDTAPDVAIDAAFLAARLTRALRLRERLFDAPYYRLAHAEADGLPGTIVDRFGDVLVVQAAPRRHRPAHTARSAVRTVRHQASLRNDSAAHARRSCRTSGWPKGQIDRTGRSDRKWRDISHRSAQRAEQAGSTTSATIARWWPVWQLRACSMSIAIW
jgi:23S rRNA G2069 N7-methylase RlmK/C1962 C5-methylase RlmI